jgi:tetratricopeptide (TPR) repeat protein
MKSHGPAREKKPSLAVPMTGAKEALSPLGVSIAVAVLAAAVFAIYSPALNFEFILDDHRFVGDPRLQSSGHIWEYFTSYVWSQFTGGPPSFYRPVFVLWMRLNFILTEASPWGWHLLSIAKHAAVAVLLALLVWKLLKDRMAALVAATLFALHPAQTESVAWVTVPDPLMSAGVLGSLLLYLEYAMRWSVDTRPPAERSRRKSGREAQRQSKTAWPGWWIAASTVACLGALMAKETAVVVPAILFAMTLIVPVQKFGVDAEGKIVGAGIAPAFRATLPFMGATVIYFLLRLNALGHISPQTQHLPWKTVLLSWPATLWFYVKVMLWPVRERAFADPNLAEAFSLRGVLLPGLGVCCVGALLAGVCVWTVRTARRNLSDRDVVGVEQALLLGASLLVLPILLTLNLNSLNPGDFLHGRYTYLPLAGLMLLIATAWQLATRRRFILLLAAGLMAVAFAVLTIQQESMWKDDFTVFTVAHQYAPHNDPVNLNLTRAHVQVALRLDEDDRCEEAMPIFDQATQKYPQDWYAWAGRGECLVKLNDLPRAEESLRRAFELSHDSHIAEQMQQVREMRGLPPMPSPN